MSQSSTISNTINMHVLPTLIPTVSIQAIPNTTVNVGDEILFTSSITNPGLNPQLYWMKNGIIVGNENYYLEHNPQIGDIIRLEFQCDVNCLEFTSFLSNSLTLDLIDHLDTPENEFIKLFPNPSQGDFLISGNYHSSFSKSTTISLLGIDGRLIQTQQVYLNSGIFSLPMSIPNSISDGIYFITIQNDELNYIQKLILSR